ncbi:hypothetical protein [Deferribacter autotrophicus]|nr:hypothetical protein [Deferribacter autotrophicus]
MAKKWEAGVYNFDEIKKYVNKFLYTVQVVRTMSTFLCHPTL